jgi:hypothetical protein
MAFLVYIIIIAIIIAIAYFSIFIRPQQKEKKKLRDLEISRINEMSISDLLWQNGLEQYCKTFVDNKIEKVKIALDLTDNDLVNMGISILGDRKKILVLLNERQTILEEDGKIDIQKIKKNSIGFLIGGIICLIFSFVPVVKYDMGLVFLLYFIFIPITIVSAKKIKASKTKELEASMIRLNVSLFISGIGITIAIINISKLAVTVGGILGILNYILKF